MQTLKQWRDGFAVRQDERHAARDERIAQIRAESRRKVATRQHRRIRKYGIVLTADTIWSPGKGEHPLAGFHAYVSRGGYGTRNPVHSWTSILVVEGPGFSFTRRVSGEGPFVARAQAFASEINARAQAAAHV